LFCVDLYFYCGLFGFDVLFRFLTCLVVLPHDHTLADERALVDRSPDGSGTMLILYFFHLVSLIWFDSFFFLILFAFFLCFFFCQSDCVESPPSLPPSPSRLPRDSEERSTHVHHDSPYRDKFSSLKGARAKSASQGTILRGVVEIISNFRFLFLAFFLVVLIILSFWFLLVLLFAFHPVVLHVLSPRCRLLSAQATGARLWWDSRHEHRRKEMTKWWYDEMTKWWNDAPTWNARLRSHEWTDIISYAYHIELDSETMREWTDKNVHSLDWP
jgi:hypothetical protein